jgi:hypothetical protein
MVYRPLLIPPWLQAGLDTSPRRPLAADGTTDFTPPQDAMLPAGTGNVATDRALLPDFAAGSDNDLSDLPSAPQDAGLPSPLDPTTLAGGGGVVDPGGPMQELATSAPQNSGSQDPITAAGGDLITGGGASLAAPQSVSSGWLGEPVAGWLAGVNNTALLSQYMAASFPQAGTFSASPPASTGLATSAAIAGPVPQVWGISQPGLSQSSHG